MFNDDSVPSGLINTILPLFSNASQCSNRSVAINQPQRSLVDEADLSYLNQSTIVHYHGVLAS
jgi:hypothetical protein